MVIDKYFLFYKRPSQYIFAGENHIDIYKSTNKTLQKTKIFENISIFDLNTENFEKIKDELSDAETGIILNSGYFIFNIFEFEKIYLKEKLNREIVEWRVKKVFPENMELYEHDFFRMGKNRILSILFKKDLKEKVEDLFEENQCELIYMGNSTVEVINNIQKTKHTPDLVIEIDRNLSMFIFLSRSLPHYIRKFRSDSDGDIVEEIEKTIHYVKNNYSKTIQTYSIVSNELDSNIDQIRDNLSQLNIKELILKNSERCLFP